jgi:hypothetical protein
MGNLENCLRQDVDQKAAEHGNCNPPADGRPPGVHDSPKNIHNDAQVHQLRRVPQVGLAGQPLKAAAAPFDSVQDPAVEVRDWAGSVFIPPILMRHQCRIDLHS